MTIHLGDSIVCRKPFGRTCRKDKHMIECAIHGNLSKRGAECEECVLERACREREEKEAGTTTKNKVEEEKHRKWLEGSNSERKPRWPQEKKDKAAIHLVDAQPDAVQGNIIQSMATPGLEILEEE